MRLVRLLLLAAAISFAGRTCLAQTYTLASPGAAVEAVVHTGTPLTLAVSYRGETVLHPSEIGLEVRGAAHTPLPHPSVERRSVREVIRPTLPEKRSTIPDVYNELRLRFGGRLALTVRAYDDGVAYRFETAFPDSITIERERADLHLSPTDTAFIALNTCREEVDCFHSSYEENYSRLPLDSLPAGRLAFLPVLVKTPHAYLSLTESDLWDYPGLWVRTSADSAVLHGAHAAYPVEERVFGGEFKQRLVTKRADYIARTAGTRTFPWRVFMLSPDAAGLIENDLVYRLARALALKETDWIEPGQSTEDWITSDLLYGVDFKSGLNTATYLHFIDFAAAYGMKYVMLDAGWSNVDDTNRIRPGVDLQAVLDHAHAKHVGILLWNLALTVDRDLEEMLDRYAAWGVRGILVDFMDRDDQEMVRFYERVVKAAAKRHLLVNFHGAYKPTGMQRTYPNQVTREAVLGHEYNMWSERVTPDHALIVPFIRMTAGPMDWEGGSMTNGTREDFRAVYSRPMNQGTRTQQLAQYVVYESPLQYLAASPSDYERAPDFTRFLTSIPTTWDETKVLQAAVGDYLLLARRKGDDWFVAVMTDWTPRTFDVPLTFLPEGVYEATIISDGPNADRYAGDYAINTLEVDKTTLLKASLAPGGGWVARIRPRQ